MIDLYTWPAPNGQKVQILVEELGIQYRVIPIDITSDAQHTPAYRDINPNGKIPTIVDHAPATGGSPITVYETGAVMFYLASKEKRFIPEEPRRFVEVMQWLFWQVSGLGPTMGQAQHFYRHAPTNLPYAITRYQKETRRLLKILDETLAGREFVCEEYSIADRGSVGISATIHAKARRFGGDGKQSSRRSNVPPTRHVSAIAASSSFGTKRGTVKRWDTQSHEAAA